MFWRTWIRATGTTFGLEWRAAQDALERLMHMDVRMARAQDALERPVEIPLGFLRKIDHEHPVNHLSQRL